MLEIEYKTFEENLEEITARVERERVKVTVVRDGQPIFKLAPMPQGESLIEAALVEADQYAGVFERLDG